MRRFDCHHSTGFSLVELSIVLVILGLLVGGILGGKSLIRAAELRTVITQHDKFYAATHTFRDKYFALPGDMPNATQFWGNVNPVNCAWTVSTDQKTCDGDGNGKIDAMSATSMETLRFWQHLANAGLIEGSYKGSSATSGIFPPGRISNTVWNVMNYSYYISAPANLTGTFVGDYGNNLRMGLSSGCGGCTPFNSQEVWSIDTKADDGKPGTGKIIHYGGGGSLAMCTTAALTTDNATANYSLDTTNYYCNPMFANQF